MGRKLAEVPVGQLLEHVPNGPPHVPRRERADEPERGTEAGEALVPRGEPDLEARGDHFDRARPSTTWQQWRIHSPSVIEPRSAAASYAARSVVVRRTETLLAASSERGLRPRGSFDMTQRINAHDEISHELAR